MASEFPPPPTHPPPPAERLIHVETEGQIRECIHTVCCVQTNSKVSNITTSICMRRSHNWMLITTTTKKKQNSLDVDTFSYLNISFGGYLRPLFLWHGPPISRVYSHYALSTMYFTKKISQVTFSSKSLQPIKSDCFDKKEKISRCAPNHFPAPSGLRTHSFVYS